MKKCTICRIIRGEIPSYKIFENKDFIAFLDINPINPGHLVVSPKKHIDYVFDLSEPIYSKIFKLAQKLSKPLKKITKAKRIGLAIEGFGISHVHLHLVPVNAGNELNPERAVKGNLKELELMAKKIRKAV
jgi:histidine triad (HIT) family protein